MKKLNKIQKKYIKNIKSTGLSIYDSIEIGDHNLWIPSPDLEAILNCGLKDFSLTGLPLRTRSKILKEKVCQILGYPTPKSFKKTQPRFPGQIFDTYIQKSHNLQIWNEDLSATRRYVIIRLNDDDVIVRVKVVSGQTLSLLDTTGTLTQKYQARCIPKDQKTELVSRHDTKLITPFLSDSMELPIDAAPIDYPKARQILPIKIVSQKLSSLIGLTFQDTGHVQDRNRGAALHQLVCAALGYKQYHDKGLFPDIPHQIIEIKLQTSPTIDLGLVSPDSLIPLDLPKIGDAQIRHCDVRYVVFCAILKNNQVVLTWKSACKWDPGKVEEIGK